MLERILGGDPLVGIVDEYLLEQVVKLLVEGSVVGDDILFARVKATKAKMPAGESAANGPGDASSHSHTSCWPSSFRR